MSQVEIKEFNVQMENPGSEKLTFRTLTTHDTLEKAQAAADKLVKSVPFKVRIRAIYEQNVEPQLEEGEAVQKKTPETKKNTA